MRSQGEILDHHEDQDQPLVLTVKGAAAELACSEAHIRRLIKSGELASIRLGKGPRSPYRVPRRVLEAYVTRKLDARPHTRPQRPQLKTEKPSGSSAAWAFTFTTVSRVGGLSG